MTDRLITIATFSGPLQAELSKAKLEGKGIRCFLTEDATHSLYGYAAGTIKLQIKESDAKRALEILECNQRKEPEEDLTEKPADLRCPKCHSEDIEYEKSSKKVFFLSILLLRFPLPFLKKRYKCNNCGHTWK